MKGAFREAGNEDRGVGARGLSSGVGGGLMLQGRDVSVRELGVFAPWPEA